MAAPAAWEKYRGYVVTLALPLLGALGFAVATPRDRVSAIDARMESVELRVDTLEELTDSVGEMVRAILRGECLDRAPRETALMGLRCDVLLRQEPR